MAKFDYVPTGALQKRLRALPDGRGEPFEELAPLLEAYIRRVYTEGRFVGLVFEEYTDHTDALHLRNMFGFADRLLKDVYPHLNDYEVYILAAAIAGHDWGMAVSRAEREYIATGTPPAHPDDFYPLEGETEDFACFLQANGGPFEAGEIPAQLWQEYLRRTHGRRSGHRAHCFFGRQSGALADAIARVCTAHTVDTSDIHEGSGYREETPVRDACVNLQALAMYLRLIDLFDLTEDRTPYVLWRYVNPQNAYSKMEWAKHRALHALVLRPRKLGRAIVVSGRTGSLEVYAALEDLHQTCQKYFTEAMDALNNMRQTEKCPDTYCLEWQVEAQGFEPMLMQFEFEREDTLLLMSSEIYNYESHVFLRELLQNSIDAINLRRTVLAGTDTPLHDGLIKVSKHTDENGQTTISWQDNGSGMNEYILRNFFSRLGQSYYRSKEFEKQQLGFAPISMFGIGVLSCFMAADDMTIVTYPDPAVHADAGYGLQVHITDVQKHFRISRLPRAAGQTGTTITLQMNNQKLQQLSAGQYPGRLDIADYLSDMAGWVEHPIWVQDEGHELVITSPTYSEESLLAHPEYHGQERYATRFGSYPDEAIFLPQDLETAREFIEYECVDLAALGIDGVEGVIYYPGVNLDILARQDLAMDCRNHISLAGPDGSERRIRWESYFRKTGSIYRKLEGNNIYLNGIWAPDLTIDQLAFRSHSYPPTYIFINIKSGGLDVTVSRTGLKPGETILQRIQQKLLAHNWDTILKKLAATPPESFSDQLANCWLQFRMPVFSASYLKELPIEELDGIATALFFSLRGEYKHVPVTQVLAGEQVDVLLMPYTHWNPRCKDILGGVMHPGQPGDFYMALKPQGIPKGNYTCLFDAPAYESYLWRKHFTPYSLATIALQGNTPSDLGVPLARLTCRKRQAVQPETVAEQLTQAFQDGIVGDGLLQFMNSRGSWKYVHGAGGAAAFYGRYVNVDTETGFWFMVYHQTSLILPETMKKDRLARGMLKDAADLTDFSDMQAFNDISIAYLNKGLAMLRRLAAEKEIELPALSLKPEDFFLGERGLEMLHYDYMV